MERRPARTAWRSSLAARRTASGRLARRRHRRGPAADARRGRQPQRVDRRGRPAVRGATPARPSRAGRLSEHGQTFDFVIIGAGPAGEAAAYKARELGASVAIVDRRWFGGSCPHIGCVPSKSLLHAPPAPRTGATYSWPRASARRDYMVNRAGRRRRAGRHAPVRALEAAGADVYRGEGRITGRGRVAVTPRRVDARAGGGQRRSSPWARRRRCRRSRGWTTIPIRGRTARRRSPASCRRASSSSAAARPAASSRRSTPGSGSR